MSSIYTRYVIQLQRAVAASSPSSSSRASRALSTTTAKRKSLPTFAKSSSPELDGILTSIREKHFIPRMLSPAERTLIFSMKTKQQLDEDPPTITLGGEDIQLKWIDQRTEIPNRQFLIKSALNLMDQGTKEDWYNLIPLFTGLHETDKTPYHRQYAKAIRLASRKGSFGTILQCLNQSERTGMSLRMPKVMDELIWALRELGRGQQGGWGKEGLEKAIKDSFHVARLLEDKRHRPERSEETVYLSDPNRNPKILGVFLELHAVYATKYQNGEDVDGQVAAFAERLLSNMTDVEAPRLLRPSEISENPKKAYRQGVETEKAVLRNAPIWHGLVLSQRILGGEMPQPKLATSVVASWHEGLQAIVSKVEKGEVREGSYAESALEVWQDCLRH